jgi:predicted nucleotidyltransferase
MQEVYGTRFLHYLPDYRVRNAETFGQRYSHCEHFREMNEEMAKARWKFIKHYQAQVDQLSNKLKANPGP